VLVASGFASGAEAVSGWVQAGTRSIESERQRDIQTRR
jgi:hypothetical protein